MSTEKREKIIEVWGRRCDAAGCPAWCENGATPLIPWVTTIFLQDAKGERRAYDFCERCLLELTV